MRIKNIFLISISALLLLSVQSVAQNRGGEGSRDGRRPFDREDFFAKRNAFITEKIALTASEAAVFIPLDNELLQKKYELGRECNRIERELREKKEKTDEECKKLLKCREEVKEKRDRLDKEYLDKFKKILSAEQILKYHSADREFFDEFIRDGRR